tara:strand:+ start:177 stop:404 length:228 start_codon:yes stop_codon:yes gene_type:complete
MHKVYFDLQTIDDWYDIIRELKRWFGNEWHGQRGVRKKFQKTKWTFERHSVWFVIPDLAFKTYMELKLANPPNIR